PPGDEAVAHLGEGSAAKHLHIGRHLGGEPFALRFDVPESSTKLMDVPRLVGCDHDQGLPPVGEWEQWAAATAVGLAHDDPVAGGPSSAVPLGPLDELGSLAQSHVPRLWQSVPIGSQRTVSVRFVVGKRSGPPRWSVTRYDACTGESLGTPQ